ncbi:MAG TPA: RHS repeat-associated core domain-containing protein [Verrucomicrobiae bacterium]
MNRSTSPSASHPYPRSKTFSAASPASRPGSGNQPQSLIVGIMLALWAWSADTAFSDSQYPADGIFHAGCYNWGTVNIDRQVNSDCGFAIERWTITGGASGTRTYTFDPDTGEWIDSASTSYFWLGPNASGCWVIVSEDTPPQGLTVTGTGYYYGPDHVHHSLEVRFYFSIIGEPCGGCLAPASGYHAELGTGNIRNDLGPVISFPLGALGYQVDAGAVVLDARVAGSELWNAAALSVPFAPVSSNRVVEVLTNSAGTLLQVRSPQGLVNVVSNAYSSQLQIFYSENVTAKGTNGLYGTNAAAFATWTIANPNGASATNQITVSLYRPGQNDTQYTYTWTNTSGTTQCHLTDSAGLRTVASWYTTTQDPTYGTLTNVIQQARAGASVLQSTEKGYALVNGKRLVIRTIEGTGSLTNTTTHYYNSADLVERTDYPDGNWEYFVYDSSGRVITKYSAHLNSAPPALGTEPSVAANGCKVTEYTYDPMQPGTYQPTVARVETISLPVPNGSSWDPHEVSRIIRRFPAEDEVEEYRCPNPGAAYTATGNLLTRTATFSDPADVNTFGKVQWQVRPDSTATIYTYQADQNGLVTNIVAQTGEPDSIINPTSIVNGTQTDTVVNSLGQITLEKTRAIVDGSVSTVLSQLVYAYSGSLQQDYTTVDLANRTNQFQYACCGLSTVVDPDGAITTFDYDGLKRLVASTVLRGGTSGIKTTNILDAAGRVLVTQRIGTNGSTITLTQNQYDVLGRLVAQTNALLGRTTFTNVTVNGQLCTTNVNPDGGTTIEIHYRDGRPQSLSGSAVALQQYLYGAEYDANDGYWREFTLTIKPDAAGATNEWIKTYTDAAARPYKIFHAAASEPYPVAISYFNSLGQLWKQTDADGVVALFGYNSIGEQVTSAIDIDQDDIIDFDGTDRITFITNDVLSAHGTNVRRTQTYVWATDNNATSNLITTVEESTDGRNTWQTSWNGASGLTNQTTTVYATDGKRYVTNTAPDGSFTIDTLSYGRLHSTTRKEPGGNQLSSVSYSYDAHGRQSAATDARNGTTTYYFNNADQVSGVLTPPPASGQSGQLTTHYFDNMGRQTATTLPDNTSVTNVFYATGQPKLAYGSRAYPVGYSYDAQGRMKTMTNWSAFASLGGSRVTTWNYDIYRGWLTNKTYDGGNPGPVYSNTAAGRLALRTWARGPTTSYGYNAGGDLSSISYSDSTPGVTNTYDRLGRQATITRNGVTTTLAYTLAGALASESYSGGILAGLAVTNGYDPFMRRTNLVVQQSSNPIIQQSFAFDAASRLQRVTDYTTANNPYSAGFTYVANSPLVRQIAFTNNASWRMTTTKQYDFLNRLTSICSVGSGSSSLPSFYYVYNDANQRTRRIESDGSDWRFNYDPLGQVTSGRKYWPDFSPVAGQQFEYGFDDIGNRLWTKAGGDENGLNLRPANYSANSLNQYTSRDVPGAFDVIGLELATNTVKVNGNVAYRKGEYFRKEVTVDNASNPVWQSVSVSATNETTVTGGVFVPKRTEQFFYDADGNLTNDGRWYYTWDAENRLIRMATNTTVGPQISLTFDYDSKSRRIRKQVWYAGAATNDLRFVYDGWNLVATLNSQLSPINAFLWGLDLSGSFQGAGGVGGLLSVWDSSTLNNQPSTHFAAYDGNGNVAALIDAADGDVVARYDFGPFGELIRATGPMAKANSFRFSTKYKDDETDLLYYGHRYYNPSPGRWVSRDPLGEDGGKNIYCILANNPIGYYDLLGLIGRHDCVPFLTTRSGWYYSFPIPPTDPTLFHQTGEGSGTSTSVTIVYERTETTLYNCDCCVYSGTTGGRVVPRRIGVQIKYYVEEVTVDVQPNVIVWRLGPAGPWPPLNVPGVVRAIINGSLYPPYPSSQEDRNTVNRLAAQNTPAWPATFGTLVKDTGVPKRWCWW